MGHFSKAFEKMASERGDKVAPVTPLLKGAVASVKKRKGGSQATGGDKSSLVVLSDPWGYSSEQFRSIKTSIMFPEDGRERRMILVTSSVPGEGKSFVATNVAASIASSMDNSVLVIDSDLKRPTVADIFSLPSEAPGLDVYLNNQCSLEDVIYQSKIDKLAVIPAGNAVVNPSELVASSAMAHMLEEVRSRYSDRYVIIDSPPPLFAPETIALSRHVDGIVVVVRNDKTLKKTVDEMLDKLDRTKVIGIVLNRYDVPFGREKGYREYYTNREQLRK